MSDDHLRALERSWREAPDDDGLLAAALTAHARAGTTPPWDLIAASPRWRGLTSFVSRWYSRPLVPGDGCTAVELCATEQRLERRLPSAVREWFLLAGRRDDFPGFSAGLVHRSPAAVSATWCLQDFVALEALKVEDDEWITLGVGHQGNGRWAFRTTDDSADLQIFVRRGFWQDDEGVSVADPVGPLGDFCLAFLIEEFLTDGAHGRGPTVRHARHRGTEDVRRTARATYDRSTICLAAEIAYSDVVGDADTLVRLDENDDVVVATRTDAAWERAVAALGAPPLLSVVGPNPPGLTTWPDAMALRAAIAASAVHALGSTPDHTVQQLRRSVDELIHWHRRQPRLNIDNAHVRRCVTILERGLEVFMPVSSGSIAQLSPQLELLGAMLRELASAAPTYAVVVVAAPPLLVELRHCGVPALETAAASAQAALALAVTEQR